MLTRGEAVGLAELDSTVSWNVIEAYRFVFIGHSLCVHEVRLQISISLSCRHHEMDMLQLYMSKHERNTARKDSSTTKQSKNLSIYAKPIELQCTSGHAEEGNRETRQPVHKSQRHATCSRDGRDRVRNRSPLLLSSFSRDNRTGERERERRWER
jgi:hypothetical protein